ncbi:intercompartmental signaling factor BofC [Niallia nealsonii]|uniref:Regulator n=1 Tax=Niallia nealsonii TaxID=115979 RepID=A0A2N0Z4J4_9BACI|nr:intercompartmental signaling factor BofC [Niallia nealsonii]PKG24420.1 regulator [Niallia nealsonii]
MKTRFLLFSTVFLFSLIGSYSMITSIGHAKASSTFQNHPKQFHIVLKRIYLDGEISEENVEETVWSMEDFWSKYDKWQLADKNSNTLVFTQVVDDISPLLKTNGYFGISTEGILTIYNGKPEKSNIIQSFFQIDLKKLESTQQKHLRKGIPIKTKDRYVEVLETFKNYTILEEAK